MKHYVIFGLNEKYDLIRAVEVLVNLNGQFNTGLTTSEARLMVALAAVHHYEQLPYDDSSRREWREKLTNRQKFITGQDILNSSNAMKVQSYTQNQYKAMIKNNSEVSYLRDHQEEDWDREFEELEKEENREEHWLPEDEIDPTLHTAYLAENQRYTDDITGMGDIW